MITIQLINFNDEKTFRDRGSGLIFVMDLNTAAWILPVLWTLAWTYGQSKPQYTNKVNAAIMVLSWVNLAAFFFLKLSPLHLYYLIPLIVGVNFYIATGLLVTIGNVIIVGAIYYFTNYY